MPVVHVARRATVAKVAETVATRLHGKPKPAKSVESKHLAEVAPAIAGRRQEQQQPLRIGVTTSVVTMKGIVAHCLRRDKRCILQATGPGAISQALRCVIRAEDFLEDDRRPVTTPEILEPSREALATDAAARATVAAVAHRGREPLASDVRDETERSRESHRSCNQEGGLPRHLWCGSRRASKLWSRRSSSRRPSFIGMLAWMIEGLLSQCVERWSLTEPAKSFRSYMFYMRHGAKAN